MYSRWSVTYFASLVSLDEFYLMGLSEKKILNGGFLNSYLYFSKFLVFFPKNFVYIFFYKFLTTLNF